MLPDWVSNPGPLTYESGALPIALRGSAFTQNSAYTGVNAITTFPLEDMQLLSTKTLTSSQDLVLKAVLLLNALLRC